jgi:hypothetical protein
MTSAEGASGMLAVLTQESPREVLDWFKEWFEDEGYESAGETFVDGPEGSFGAVTGHSPDTGRTISVTLAETEDGTGVTINYGEEG